MIEVGAETITGMIGEIIEDIVITEEDRDLQNLEIHHLTESS